MNEYAVVSELDLQRLQAKVNILAADGYYFCGSYGVPDHRGMVHTVWMCKYTKSGDAMYFPMQHEERA